VGLARQLAGSLQEQLQQQRTDVREQLQQATAREQRPQHEALEREHRQAAETRRMQEDACKAQEAAYNIELERARQADRREDRLFDQFLECTDKTRSDLNEAALLRERAARLELELQHACEAAAAAVERTHTDATLPMQSQYLHLPPPTQTVAVAVIHPSPASFADTPRSTTTPVPASFSVVELLPLVPTRVVEIPQTTPPLTAETVVPQPAHCHPPLAPVSHTLPPPAHSHYTPMTRTRMHTYTGLPTGMDVHSYSNVQLLTTATTTTTPSVSQPRTYYNLGESIAEQEL